MIDILNFFKEFDLHQILTTLGIVWILTRSRFKKIDAKFEKIDLRFEKIDLQFEKVHEKLNNIEKSMGYINSHIARLEGRFEERGQWESRDKKIGE